MTTLTQAPVRTEAQHAAVRQAERHEAEALDYPGEAADCLLDAADAWRTAGEPERAIAVLAGWPAWPDALDAGMARVDIIESLYVLGRDEQAEAALAELRRERPVPGVCEMAAGLLAERGDPRSALGWYELAVSGLSQAEVASATTRQGIFGMPRMILGGRADVRSRLGMPADELDEAVQRAADQTLALLQAAASGLRAFPDSVELLASGRLRPGVQARTLFWPRAELAAARERWPGLLDGDAEAYYRGLEQSWREVRGLSGRDLVLIPARVELLAAHAAALGQPVAESATRHSYLQERQALGDVASWPPGRNDRCWCGSEAKYKRCCARA